MKEVFKYIIDFIRDLYFNEVPIPLHAPKFLGNEKKYLNECIDTTYVSYIGEFVNKFEEHIKVLAGTKYAIAIVNGTSALQITLRCIGVTAGDEVITQPLTFAATAAAIKHVNAEPVFVDIDKDTLGMSPLSLLNFLEKYAEQKNNGLYNKITKRKISAVIPVHILGHPTRIDEIVRICSIYNLPIIEDAAESIGSLYKDRHVGTFGKAGIISFNGNKTVTTGGGGMIITDDKDLAQKIKHLTTTAKVPHKWEIYHDDIGYNLRMPNINAAIGCAQMEYIDYILQNKRETANVYKNYFDEVGIPFLTEPQYSRSNYWLNAIILNDRVERDDFLEYSNNCGVQTRPLWNLLSELLPYKDCFKVDLKNAEWIQKRVVCIPSSIRTR